MSVQHIGQWESLGDDVFAGAMCKQRLSVHLYLICLDLLAKSWSRWLK